MIFLKFLGSIFHMIGQTMEESVSPNEDFKKSRKVSSIFRGSLKSSKSKIDEFFKNKNCEFKKKAKKFKKDDDEPVQQAEKKRKISKMAEFLTPILSLRKSDTFAQKSYAREGQSLRRSCDKVSSSSFRKQNSYWHDSLAKCDLTCFNKQQLDRQEAIYELYRSEVDLIEDLQMICKTYRDSMLKLNLINHYEASVLFSDIQILIPVHRELADNLARARLPDGRTEDVGHVILKWIPKLAVYMLYCTNQVAAKEFIEYKTRSDPSFKDFLDRCLSCPFSRRLDLWTFLDAPRSKLVKYPLLFKSILKHTALDHPDHLLLSESLELIEEVIREVDFNAGRAKCHLFISKLEYENPKQMHPLIDESSLIVCDGALRTKKGVKLHVFLLDKILVLTRSVKSDPTIYRVYKRPIPLSNLFLVEDVNKKHQYDGKADGAGEMGGVDGSRSSVRLERKDSGFSSPGASISFRNVLSSLSQHRRTSTGEVGSSCNISSCENRIELINCESCWGADGGKSRLLLTAENELDKQHWMQCLRRHVTGVVPDSYLCRRKAPVLRDGGRATRSSVSSARFESWVFGSDSANRLRYWNSSGGSMIHGRFLPCATLASYADGRTEPGDCSVSTISSYSSFLSVFSDSSSGAKQDVDVGGKENLDDSLDFDGGHFGFGATAETNAFIPERSVLDDDFYGNRFGGKLRFLSGAHVPIGSSQRGNLAQ